MSEKKSQNMIFWFFLMLFILSIFLMGWLIWPFISIIILAAVVTGLFTPVYHFIKVDGKINAPAASMITCLLIFIILFIPIVFFVGILSKEAYQLYLMGRDAVISDQLKLLLQNSRILERTNLILSNIDIKISGEELNRLISELGKFVGLFIYEQARVIASNTLRFVINFFFMLLIIYFLLIDGQRLIEFITDLSPLPRQQNEKLIKKFKEMAGAILIGNGVAGLIQGVVGGVVFALFGIQAPFMWGVIMGVLAFLPIVGIGAVFVPAAAYLFLTGRIAAGIFFIVFYIFLSGGIEYLFKPKLVGSQVKMHTLLVFIAIIGGMKLFGILGIIYGPLVVTAFLTLTDIYHSNYQDRVLPDARPE
jgi:predicted PurR-regulated permease PerM